MEALIRNTAVNEQTLICDTKRIAHPNDPSTEFRLLGKLRNLRNLSLVQTGCSSLEGFPHLPYLVKLNLSDNKLTNVNALSKANLLKLRTLTLSNNRFIDFASISALQALPSLKRLDLSECPLAQNADYREMIFSLIPTLQVLDGENSDGIEVDTEEEEAEEEEDFEDDNDDEENDGGAKGPAWASKHPYLGGKTGGKSRMGKYPSKTGKVSAKSSKLLAASDSSGKSDNIDDDTEYDEGSLEDYEANEEENFEEEDYDNEEDIDENDYEYESGSDEEDGEYSEDDGQYYEDQEYGGQNPQQNDDASIEEYGEDDDDEDNELNTDYAISSNSIGGKSGSKSKRPYEEDVAEDDGFGFLDEEENEMEMIKRRRQI